MKTFLRNNGLSLAMFALFAVFLVGQGIAGFIQHNEEQRLHGQAAVTFLQFLASGDFLEAVFENWESEFLQMGLYVVLTAYLFQRGSAESKSLSQENEVDREPAAARGKDSPWPVWKGGLVLRVYKHSLSIALLTLFAASFLLHAAAGAAQYRTEQAEHGHAVAMSMWQFMGSARFWHESFQNWQSEFLSIGVLVVLSIFLREKGSPESKPVAASHREEEAA
jgi:hypothetical protein